MKAQIDSLKTGVELTKAQIRNIDNSIANAKRGTSASKLPEGFDPADPATQALLNSATDVIPGEGRVYNETYLKLNTTQQAKVDAAFRHIYALANSQAEDSEETKGALVRLLERMKASGGIAAAAPKIGAGATGLQPGTTSPQ